MAVKNSRNFSGLVIYWHLKNSAFTAGKMDARKVYETGTFLSKIVHKRVRMGPRGEASPYKTWLGSPSGSSGFVPNSRWLSWEKRKYLRLCRSLVVVTSREGAVKPTNILWTLPFQISHESWCFTYYRLTETSFFTLSKTMELFERPPERFHWDRV